MNIFKIKRNDTNPALSVTLQYSNGSAVDLTGATSLVFNMGNLTDYSAYRSGVCTVLSSGAGQCEYRWQTSDTGSVGTYWGEFEIKWSGSIMTLPNDHSLQIKIYEDY